MKHIFIIGGGIGGVNTAIMLAKQYGTSRKIVLISNRDHAFVYPFSMWVPVKKRRLEEISISLSKISKKYGFTFLHETVLEIISKENKIKTNNDTYNYDYLIVSPGCMPGSIQGSEHVMNICGKPNDVLRMQQRIEYLLQRRKGTITCGLALNEADTSTCRLGPALEMLLNIEYFLREQNCRDSFKLIFYLPDLAIFERYGGLLFRKNMLETLKDKGVQVLEASAASFHEDSIQFTSGETLLAEMNIFCPQLLPNELIKNTDFNKAENGFLPIDDYCRINGTTNCFAIGDSVTYDGPGWQLKQGKIAEYMAKTVVENIKSQDANKSGLSSFKSGLGTLFILDMGADAIFLSRNQKGEKFSKGKRFHYMKLLLEKVIMHGMH